MKTDVYFNYMGKTISLDHLKLELAGLKKTMEGLIVWFGAGENCRPVTHMAQMTAARAAAIRAALERAVGLIEDIDVGWSVEVLEEQISRLESVIWGGLLIAGALGEGVSCRPAGGPRAMDEILATLGRARQKAASLTPDSAAMALEMMVHGRILAEKKTPAEPEEAADDLNHILGAAVQNELKRRPEPLGGWTTEKFIQTIFPGLGKYTEVPASGQTIFAAAIKTLSQKAEPKEGWRICDIKLAIIQEHGKRWSRPFTEKDAEKDLKNNAMVEMRLN